jgi:hypothetical protein
MSFLAHTMNTVEKALPYGRQLDPVGKSLSDYILKKPPPAPGVPNPNDAANASQSVRDQMRQRRGLLANIYAGASNQAPVSGKTQLGT